MFDFPNIGPKNQLASAMCASRQSPKNDGISPVPPKASFHGHQRTTGKQPTKSIMNMSQKRIHDPNLFVAQKDLQRMNLVLCMYVRTYVRKYVRMSVCLSVCTYVRTDVRMYVCVHTCMSLKFLSSNLARF